MRLVPFSRLTTIDIGTDNHHAIVYINPAYVQAVKESLYRPGKAVIKLLGEEVTVDDNPEDVASQLIRRCSV